MLNEIIERMGSGSDEARSSAGRELTKLANSGTLSLDDAAMLIRASMGKFKFKDELDDPSLRLLAAARSAARDKDPSRLIPEVERASASLGSLGKQAALSIVTLAHTREGAMAYLRLLAQIPEDPEQGFLPTFEASAGPEVAGVLFPSILEHVRDRRRAFPIYQMLLEFRQRDLVQADVAKKHHGSIVGTLKEELVHARTHQRERGLGWREESPYADCRDLIGLIFDLAGHLGSKSLLSVVHQSSDLFDPRLRRFRAVALLNRGANVPDAELEWIARSPRDRYWLLNQLRKIGAVHRLPSACLDQALIAEGAMVDWLCYPTELGREPDEIILFAKESRSASSGPRLVRWLMKREMVDYYFFRFRVTEEHWSKEQGWTVGMAGGYARKDQPTTSHDGGTFSTFGKWEEKSPAEHVAGYLS